MANVRTYSPSVRVGNWNEDLCLEEDTLKDFLDKRDSGELLVQKTHNLLQNTLKKVDLSVTTDGLLHFGDTVMIVNPGAERNDVRDIRQRDPTALCLNISEYKAHLAAQVEAPCPVSASRIIKPCIRNAFVITSVDGTPNGQPLRYGQDFALSTTEGYAGNLKLHSDRVSFLKCAKKSRQQEVSLVSDLTHFTRWKTIAFEPQLRMEYEGLPVQANVKLLITHCKTHQHLNIAQDYVARTPFGYEYEVTAHMDLDSHRAEKETNHWVIITGTPTDDGRTMFDKPRPDPSGLTDRPMEGTGEIRNAGLDPKQTKPPPKTEEKPTMEEMLTQIEQTAKGGEAPLQTQ
ncbi:cilia- and flagella-associated protein 161-like [Branchiostoma floridae]|uniref:Cilia- and flagella-associated protein 161-like n=1 Tax=Branchiostoma floridae TaxID=7739 RepID=A0A9J7HPT4_BRAFL|nr:cilia- and flagella-associated protein 161-like [Branchiostoma floridae]